MKVNIISFSFHKGGAAIAANRFKTIAMKQGFLDVSAVSQDEAGLRHHPKRLVSFFLGKLQRDKNSVKHSLNLFSYKPAYNALLSKDVHVNHVNWFNNDTLSIFSLDKLPPGSIVTLHDEWLYCGAEHCHDVFSSSEDYIEGYRLFNSFSVGVNWNYFVWRMKRYKLSSIQGVIFTAPSSWLLDRAMSSKVLKGKDIRLLPNPVDTSIFKTAAIDAIARRKRSLLFSDDDIIISFGAVGKGGALKGKGLLFKSLEILSQLLPMDVKKKVKILEFGGNSEKSSTIHGFCFTSVGYISSSSDMALLYSLSDCVVVPSLVESFGQVAAEALSCQTPVVSFRTSGLCDVIIDGLSGLMARPYSTQSLAEKLQDIVLMEESQRKELGFNGRKHIVENFSYPVVEEKYMKIIDDAFANRRSIFLE